uniref:Uncharacterized protein n=1 Tax=Anguilla anguilla TaxID=7936 RepID=A0A0E9R1P6_ANGAN
MKCHVLVVISFLHVAFSFQKIRDLLHTCFLKTICLKEHTRKVKLSDVC